MHRRARIQKGFQGLLAAAVLTSAGPVVANATETTRLEMQLHDGRLSAHLVEAPFTRVLAEIASLSGASVTGIDPADIMPTTVSFSDLPLADALERLLQGRNHLLVYANDAQGAHVRRIVLLNGGTTNLAPAAPAAGVAPAAPEHSPGAESGPDQVDPVLAEALDLLRSGLALGEPEIRLLLVDEVASWQPDEPSRTVLLARLSGDPDQEVREAALQALQAGRPDVSSVVGVGNHRHGPARHAERIEGQAA